MERIKRHEVKTRGLREEIKGQGIEEDDQGTED